VIPLDREGFERLIGGRASGPAAGLARGGLGLAAIPYRMAVAARNLAFDRGWKQIHRAGVPVVSIGNLTLGGTGKTPMVEWVARWYRNRGVRVALISRGYGQRDGLNDEGLVLDQNLPDVPHLQNPDRVAMARVAVEELESELIVLDDGFQHRRLGRDVDIVLLDALEPFGYRRLFPRGLLREPLSSLRRATVVVLSRADLVPLATRVAIRSEAARSTAPNTLRWAEARHAPIDLIDADLNSESVSQLESRRVLAFCGIGNPEGFRRTLAPLCGEIVELKVFPDHHLYMARDVEFLREMAAASGADLVLTTQKDLVKLRTLTLGNVPLRALRIGLEVMAGESILDEVLTPLLPPSS
jgi:tetraacyldisaccharide 4'-kinase